MTRCGIALLSRLHRWSCYALEDYVLLTWNTREQYFSDGSDPLILPLKGLPRPLSVSVVTDLLNECIARARLDSKQYKAKCFRPTGCIHAIGPSFIPRAVMKAGRWKSGSVFLHHYVCLNRESLPKVPFQRLGEMSLPFLRMANNGQRRRIRRVCDGKGTLLA